MTRVALLAGDSATTAMLYHYLAARFDVQPVVVEEPPDRVAFVRRRIQRLGAARVANQLVFQSMVAPLLGLAARARRRELVRDAGLSTEPIPAAVRVDVPSVNDARAADAILASGADVVVLKGTRILSAATIARLGRPILNMHAGITPLYRGVHGAYWALVDQDLDRCGVTVHRVDAGIDTGAILEQVQIVPTDRDSYATYPYLQLIAGLGALARAIEAEVAHTSKPVAPPAGRSRLWSHPTLTGYLYARWMLGVK